LLSSLAIEIIIDGGWAVDALMEEQTRKHDDLDIAVNSNKVPKLRRVLLKRGFTDFPVSDTSNYNFVLADNNGNKIDVHAYLFDEIGNSIYGIPYPKDCFFGMGKINGRTVKCIKLEWLVKFHTYYEIDENDYHDVKLLYKKFKLELPLEYQKFISIVK